VSPGPARGLPPRIYVPIVTIVMIAVLGVIGYFLKIGLGVTGAALGPSVAQGDANLAAPAGPNDVGGGTPAQAAAAAPPPPVARLLVELRDRVARNPRDGSALASLGSMYFEAGKFAQALPYYERALALDPNDAAVRTDYAAAFHALGQDGRALQELQTVLAKRPGYGDALFDEGVVAHAAGHSAQAVTAFKQFLRVAPSDERAGDARAALRDLGS
jgi:cytochrome c-type biogenesis protein CcmH/NrfG